MHASSSNGALYPALRRQANEAVKELTTECLPAAGGSIVSETSKFALRRINNLREVSGEALRRAFVLSTLCLCVSVVN